MRGIDKFRERFAGHEGEYVLIGGSACDLLFGEAGQDFRATKDLDLVLLVEALTPGFGRAFWDFVREGGYENKQASSGRPQFYRFSKPKDPSFPTMLELFARTNLELADAGSGLAPIHIDDEVSSLSAILLDEDYYRLLVDNRTLVDGVAVLSVEGLIPFKAKAWLDLSERRAAGQGVDEKSVKKHRNDVCRLATLLTGGERPSMTRGGARRHAALHGGLRVRPRGSQGAEDKGSRGATGGRGSKERLPVMSSKAHQNPCICANA